MDIQKNYTANLSDATGETMISVSPIKLGCHWCMNNDIKDKPKDDYVMLMIRINDGHYENEFIVHNKYNCIHQTVSEQTIKYEMEENEEIANQLYKIHNGADNLTSNMLNGIDKDDWNDDDDNNNNDEDEEEGYNE